MLMTCDMGNRVTLKDGATQATQLCVLGVLEGIAFESFEFNANGIIVAIISSAVTGNAGMPSTVIATDKLQEFTGAEDEKMRRYLDAPDALEIRVLVPIKLIGKQVLYMVSAILARWQADRMQHNQVNLRSIWARAKIWRWALICQRVPAVHPSGSIAIHVMRTHWRSRCCSVCRC